MRVALVAYLLHQGADYRAAGVSLYAHELLTWLPRVRPHDEFTALHGRDAGVPLGVAGMASPVPTARAPVRILWEQMAVPFIVRRPRFDLLHGLVNVVPLAGRIPQVVTVHDLAFLRHPERFAPAKARYLRLAVTASVRRSRHVIAVSSATRDDLVSLLSVPAEHITVIPLGIHPRFRPADGERAPAVAGVMKDRPYILHVGTLEPRKNIDVLIRAYGGARRRAGLPHALALAGARGWMYDDLFHLVADLGLEEDVRFVDYVPPEALPHWYNCADLFAYPSEYEGFGLPVAEAMACGVPVITSSTPALAELAGDAAALVEPGSVEALEMEIVRLLSDPALARDLARRGRERAAAYSWERTAEQTARVYEQVRRECGR